MERLRKPALLLFGMVCCTFLFSRSHAQNAALPFPHITQFTTENGLPGNNVYNLLEDHKGFLWVATNFGLSRYDGYTFKNYSYDIRDKHSLTAGWCSGLMEDEEGIIWLVSGTEGFYSFNPKTEKFHHYRHEPGNTNSIANDVIDNSVYSLSSGVLWLCTLSGLDGFNTKTKKFKHFTHRAGDSTSIASNQVRSILLDEKGNLFVGYDSVSIDYFDTKSEKVTGRFTFYNSTGQSVKIGGFNPGNNGNYWMGVIGGGLVCFNPATGEEKYFAEKPYSNFAPPNVSSPIYEDANGNLWMGSDLQGLDFFDRAENKFHHYTKAQGLGTDIDVVFSIIPDRSGKIWIGTEQSGLFAVDTKYKAFTSYRSHAEDPNSVASNLVISFMENQEGRFYVCSKGVDFFDKATGKFTGLSLIVNGKDFLKDNPVWSCMEDSKGMIWFCTGDGLVSYNPKSKDYRTYVYDAKDPQSLGDVSCTGIAEDSKGNYWTTSWPNGGLQSFNPLTGKFKSFNTDKKGKSLPTKSLGGFIPDLHGNFYLGSWNGGMIIFNPAEETFQIFRHNADDTTSLSSDIVFDMEESKSGIVWVTTMGGGLNAYNPRTGKFKAYTTRDGLPSNAVMSIVEDNNKNYWLGTLSGISCFTPPADPFDEDCHPIHFRNYSSSDGLPANDLQLRGAYKAQDGKLYFGTQSKGFFYFNPDELKDNAYVPPVYLTEFKLFNQPVGVHDSARILNVPIEDTREITLTYQQNMISFAFSALNFIHPEKNQYAYMLVGFDKDWIYTDAARRFANYTNLDPGEYLFKVKGSNNDGLWNEKFASVKLIILPPYWQTWWFRILAAAAVVAAIYALYRYRLNHILKLQSIRNNIASDLHDDIGSTLNSISVYSEVARQEAGRPIPSLVLIGGAARKVVESMSDIVWTINPENDNFEKVIVRMRSFSYQLMKAKKIEFLFDADPKLNEMALPMQARKNFYLIFKEAINNLAKYSEATRASITLKSENGNVLLAIRDNGKGFETTQRYDGNGMFTMKRRADEMGAHLKIESTPGNGTFVELVLKT